MNAIKFTTILKPPVLNLVKPESPNWWAFVELSASNTQKEREARATIKPRNYVHYRNESSNGGIEISSLIEHEVDLMNKEKKNYFLYSNENVLGGAETEIRDQQLAIQRVFIKKRLQNQGHGTKVLTELETWAKKEGLKQLCIEEPLSYYTLFCNKIDAVVEQKDGKVIYRKSL